MFLISLPIGSLKERLIDQSVNWVVEFWIDNWGIDWFMSLLCHFLIHWFVHERLWFVHERLITNQACILHQQKGGKGNNPFAVLEGFGNMDEEYNKQGRENGQLEGKTVSATCTQTILSFLGENYESWRQTGLFRHCCSLNKVREWPNKVFRFQPSPIAANWKISAYYSNHSGKHMLYFRMCV